MEGMRLLLWGDALPTPRPEYRCQLQWLAWGRETRPQRPRPWRNRDKQRIRRSICRPTDRAQLLHRVGAPHCAAKAGGIRCPNPSDSMPQPFKRHTPIRLPTTTTSRTPDTCWPAVPTQPARIS